SGRGVPQGGRGSATLRPNGPDDSKFNGLLIWIRAAPPASGAGWPAYTPGGWSMYIGKCLNEADNRLFHFGKVLSFKRGSTLFSEGETAVYCYQILSGVVQTCRYRGNGDRQITGFFFANDLIGINLDAYRATATASTEATAIRLDRREPEASGEAERQLSAGVSEALNQAVERAESRIEILGLRGATARIATFLLVMAERGDRSGLIDLPMHRMDIADYLALDTATVSRTLSRFTKLGVI